VRGSDLVRKEGLEPTCLSALEPKSSASTNSATFAVAELYPKKAPSRTLRQRTTGRYNAENSNASDPGTHPGAGCASRILNGVRPRVFAAKLPVEHYENFPVASWLLPRALRAPIEAIYAFARGADDIADEGEATAGERLAALDRYVRALDAIEAGDTPQDAPFARLAGAVREHALPVPLLRDLIDAFRQDVLKKRYETYAELRDYARRSANPVGRLVLHVMGDTAPAKLEQSDAICSALQFINFWQDVAVDWRKDRVYIPREDLERFGVRESDIAGACADARWRALMEFECARSRELLASGAPLARALPGRLGLEIRATVAGGAAILDKIAAVGGDVFHHRPALGARDWIRIVVKTLMKTGTDPTRNKSKTGPVPK
jgi:squalene synthase HpnC